MGFAINIKVLKGKYLNIELIFCQINEDYKIKNVGTNMKEFIFMTIYTIVSF